MMRGKYEQENSNFQKVVALLYSGGCDSTLSAAILAESFDTIHLITIKHYATWNVRMAKVNVAKLQRRFPNVIFKHVFLNSSKLFLKLQKYFFNDFFNFRFLTLYVCGACKLAMHTELIIYSLKNNIYCAASGASHEMNMFPAQTEGGIKQLENYYREYGIKLLCPVFLEKDADRKAVAIDIMDRWHLKEKHKWDRPSKFYMPVKNIVNNIQGFCLWILGVDLYHVLVKERISSHSISMLSSEYYKRKIKTICRDYIANSIKRAPLYSNK